MKLDSKNLVLNLLGTDANIQINKKILLILKLYWPQKVGQI